MTNMDKTRKREIDRYMAHETNAPESRGIAAMCSAILVRERVQQRYRPEEIAELKTVYDHCRLRLRSGEVFLARWAPAGGLRLEKIVGEGDRNARCSA